MEIWPSEQGTNPVNALNNVLFPDPLGPITAQIDPVFSPMETLSTATTPPNRTVTSCAFNIIF
jgi:hypothetical protein